MNFLLFLSDAIIPLLIFSIVGYGLITKHNIYDDFIKGAKDGFETVIGIMPTLIGLMIGVGILRASGFLDSCYHCKNVFFFCSYRSGTGHFQGIWTGFLLWHHYFHHDELHRNHFLYHECLLYECKSAKNPLHPYRCLINYSDRNHCKCNSCRISINICPTGASSLQRRFHPE